LPEDRLSDTPLGGPHKLTDHQKREEIKRRERGDESLMDFLQRAGTGSPQAVDFVDTSLEFGVNVVPQKRSI
jgi:hypothetical protein